MTRRSGSVSMRITVSDVWKGTPDSATTAGTVGRLPAATTIRSAVSATSGPVDVQLAGTGEPGVALVERDVAAPVGAVVPPGRGDRVDPAEHAVADVGPAHLVDGRVDPQMAGPAHGAGEVGGVHEHLGGDAADVEAGATERPVLDERHVEVLEPRVEERVARAGADDDQVVVPHGQRLDSADMDGTVRAVRGPDLTTAALHGLLRLRVDVFVVEQRCAYAELDGRDLDPGTVHFVLGPAVAPLATCASSARRAGNGASGACAPRRPPGGAGWAGACWRRRCGRPATRRACSTPRSTSLGCTVDSVLSRAAPATTGTGFRTCPCAARPGEPDPMRSRPELSKEEDTAT